MLHWGHTRILVSGLRIALFGALKRMWTVECTSMKMGHGVNNVSLQLLFDEVVRAVQLQDKMIDSFARGSEAFTREDRINASLAASNAVYALISEVDCKPPCVVTTKGRDVAICFLENGCSESVKILPCKTLEAQ